MTKPCRRTTVGWSTTQLMRATKQMKISSCHLSNYWTNKDLVSTSKCLQLATKKPWQRTLTKSIKYLPQTIVNPSENRSRISWTYQTICMLTSKITLFCPWTTEWDLSRRRLCRQPTQTPSEIKLSTQWISWTSSPNPGSRTSNLNWPQATVRKSLELPTAWSIPTLKWLRELQ